MIYGLFSFLNLSKTRTVNGKSIHKLKKQDG